jgi:predicted transcriptional regulator
VPPDDVPKRFTSFRLPVELDEDLRNMAFVTRRSKQDLLIEAVTDLVRRWKRDRARRAG